MLLLCFIVFAWNTVLWAQDSDKPAEPEKKKKEFAFTLGAAAGNFANDAAKFTSVYSNRSISKIYFGAIGTTMFQFIGKYREFYAFGTSKVENIAVTGRADWKQKFYAAGLHVRTEDQPLYAEVLYIVTRAEESITTTDPVIEELTSEYKTEAKGIGFAVGIATKKIIGPFGIYAEVEFDAMLRKGRNQQGKVDPELGGFSAGAGVFFEL